jgi:aspartyl-tRNA(Asn)/glutamyl-tRNA(Gln) amidotransferase subunit A
VAKLREAGAVILGKTNMHEFAFGITTNNTHYGPTKNPYDFSKIPGGSSGGSGAATSAALCAGAIGSDTGGSVRIPAALCGVVGLKSLRINLKLLREKLQNCKFDILNLANVL